MDDETPAGTPEDNPFGSVVSRWEEVLEDMAATAADYGDAGWETVQLHPGDVSVLAGEGPDDRAGLDVLVPDDEFERLADAVADREFDSYDVFRGRDEGVVFLLVGLTDADGDVAVFVPAYYELTDVEPLQAAARDGSLRTYVRRLEREEFVEFEHDDPAPFFPDSDGLEGRQ